MQFQTFHAKHKLPTDVFFTKYIYPKLFQYTRPLKKNDEVVLLMTEVKTYKKAKTDQYKLNVRI